MRPLAPAHLARLKPYDPGKPIDEVRRGVKVIARAYEAQHAEKNFSYYIEEGTGHVLSDTMWKRTSDFFDRHLRG